VTADERDVRYSTPLGDPDTEQVSAFWSRFIDTSGRPPRNAPEPWCFGDSVELADELIELVLDGPKRATAGSVAEYEAEDETLPRVGDLSIVMDGSMRPRAVLETSDVRVGPLSSVDDRFAWDEGEGDRTRTSWLDAHHWYFKRSYQRMGLEFNDEIPVVFERFDVVYREDGSVARP